MRTLCHHRRAMLVLGFETSTNAASVALLRDGKTLSEHASTVRAQHGETLLPLMEACLRDGHVDLSDIALMAVSQGPGSFTGLRIGLATVKGLWLARRVPLIGVGSLHALAQSMQTETALRVGLFDAFKNEVFAAVYERVGEELVERLAPICVDTTTAVSAIETVLKGRVAAFAGDGARKFESVFRAGLGASFDLLDAQYDSPRAHAVASIGARNFARDGAADAARLLPMYIRSAESTFKIPTSI